MFKKALLSTALLLLASSSFADVYFISITGAGGAVNGVQMALFEANASSVYGVQFPLAGCARANDVNGVQLAPIAYCKTGSLSGVQCSVPVNVADAASGLQLALVNVSHSVDGLQFGLVNCASEGSCVQIGLINVNKGANFPCLPFFNIGGF